MRAKSVNENKFERSQDPKRSMGIGKFEKMITDILGGTDWQQVSVDEIIDKGDDFLIYFFKEAYDEWLSKGLEKRKTIDPNKLEIWKDDGDIKYKYPKLIKPRILVRPYSDTLVNKKIFELVNMPEQRNTLLNEAIFDKSELYDMVSEILKPRGIKIYGRHSLIANKLMEIFNWNESINQ